MFAAGSLLISCTDDDNICPEGEASHDEIYHPDLDGIWLTTSMGVVGDYENPVDIEYAGATSPYTEDDFKIVPMGMKDKRCSLHILLPEPEAPPECEAIIMCYKISKKGLYDLHYFTIEKTEDGSALCEWTKNFLHITHGPLTPMGELMRDIQRGV